jgi:hypothetical protein
MCKDVLSECDMKRLKNKMRATHTFTSVYLESDEICFYKEASLSNEKMIEYLNEYLEEWGFTQKAELTLEDHDQE